MTSVLAELAGRVEKAPAMRRDRTLNREVALAVGWSRLTPSESRKSHPTWYHPDDTRNGKPVIDSLHGTDVWREPLDYLGSLDAAMTLVPEGFKVREFEQDSSHEWAWWCWLASDEAEGTAQNYSAPLALCAATLCARAALALSRKDRGDA